MLLLLLNLGQALGSVDATCNVFETKCLDTEFAFDLTGKTFLTSFPLNLN